MAARTVSVKDVAQRAGVALGTVSNVLNRPEAVSESTRARVLAAIDELGYVRNESARQLRAGRSTTIGFVALDLSNPFFTDVARGAEAVIREAGSVLLLANSDGGALEARYLDVFEEQRFQGVLLSPSGDVAAQLTRLRQRGIPVVLVDAQAPSAEISSVGADDVAGGRLAASHLLAAGRERLAFVGGPGTLHQIRDRITGAREALAEAGRDPSSLEVLGTDAPTVVAGREVGYRIAAMEPARRPDAIFAANDLLALGLLQAILLEERLRVPDDVAIVGYDDIGWAGSAVVPLTSVRQPAELIGRRGAELLLREAGRDPRYAPEHVLFTPELVARASSAP
ncbi:transcriptional regulator, LacI family [Beutenbergia cavernae DSM 12333]|uniref:Transcriptional regulator, LacI family n=1 Tax=Beutenbergia cavernae (strain ATCC BAA-8 / DSM 12333 / CCUG 43141 / JCM 11478 / NBRC 16432 / NCIMB 13614 / HKI 0122) TaxID=471853 RepID=C5C306_BEUC1|nr:LacI family DNA-binding transcriptional regulator [Beutenbergia cavernae]ACQ81850.1 transcriptional regulator, LacI family [Beutenbergia cavernae DSM 12333]